MRKVNNLSQTGDSGKGIQDISCELKKVKF